VDGKTTYTVKEAAQSYPNTGYRADCVYLQFGIFVRADGTRLLIAKYGKGGRDRWTQLKKQYGPWIASNESNVFFIRTDYMLHSGLTEKIVHWLLQKPNPYFVIANLTLLDGSTSKEAYFLLSAAAGGVITKARAVECLAFVRDLIAVVLTYIIAARAKKFEDAGRE
jgi:hypothetical protein